MAVIDDQTVSKRVIRRLCELRTVSLGLQLGVIALVHLWLHLEVLPLLLVSFLLMAFNGAVYWRLQRAFPATDAEIALHLCVDALALAALLYFAGGSTNPFVSLFLVTVVLAAAYLRVVYIVAVLLFCVLCYTLLLKYYQPLPSIAHHASTDFRAHVLGMWLTFILSAITGAVLVHLLSRSSQQRDRQLAQMQQRLLRNEHVVSLGAMAAGTAHALNTPLSTILLLANEIGRASGDDQRQLSKQRIEQTVEDAQEIATQVAHCQTHLQRLQQAASFASGQRGESVPLRQTLQAIVESWSVLRSEIEIDQSLSVPDHLTLGEHQALSLIVMNLLNNAADASLENHANAVRMAAFIDGFDLVVEIEDFGKGLSESQLALVGRVSFSTKDDGLGLGLVLSSVSVEQLDGRLGMHRLSHGGMMTRVRIPLHALNGESGTGALS